MTLNEYQAEAAKTAIYPEAGTGSKDAINYCIMLLNAEAGSAANKFAKILRGDFDDDPKGRFAMLDKIVHELEGALWALSQAAYELDVSLQEVGARNIAQLQDRQARGTLRGSGDDR